MIVCPHCKGPHTLSQCPTWRVPCAAPLAVAFLYLAAAPLRAILTAWHLAVLGATL